MDWTNCLKKALSKEVTLDKNLISSLIDSAEKKIKAETILPENLPEPKITLIY
ncbi:MAG: hypothetical protein U9Q69_05380 [Nanoarchaeota archaeon]|nr:hypothetical protein [Nanoarchaeota archaeon]